MVVVADSKATRLLADRRHGRCLASLIPLGAPTSFASPALGGAWGA